MEEAFTESQTVDEEALELGILLGQSQALALVSGRCSAAQAALLVRLRDEKKFRRFAGRWRDFCSQYLKISGAQADYIISLWKKYGAAFFELRQLIRISPEVYRTIEPQIQDCTLHFNGEVLEFDAENAREIAAAVAELRRTLPPRNLPHKERHEPTVPERIVQLDQRCAALLAEFAELASSPCDPDDRRRFAITLNWASSSLQQIESENGLQ